MHVTPFSTATIHGVRDRVAVARAGRSRAFGPVAGLTVQPVQVGAARFDRRFRRDREGSRSVPTESLNAVADVAGSRRVLTEAD